jgi:hypothetical protein
MLAALALAVALASPTPVASPSAETVYLAALARMRETRQPGLLTYRAHLSVPNGAISASRTSKGYLYLRFGQGDFGASDATFYLRVARDYASYGVQLGSEEARTRLPMLNATWQGIDDWIRYGFDGDPHHATPAPSASPSPGAQNMRVIATVSSFGLAYYHARFGAPEPCANKDEGQVIDLAPVGDPYAHPLRSVTIDRSTGVFCTMHFIAPASAPFGYSAVANVTLRLADANDFLIVRKEEIDMVATAPRRPDEHSYATITFSNFVIGL